MSPGDLVVVRDEALQPVAQPLHQPVMGAQVSEGITQPDLAVRLHGHAIVRMRKILGHREKTDHPVRQGVRENVRDQGGGQPVGDLSLQRLT